jgi:acyl dehydratase
MRFDPDHLLALDMPETVQSYDARACALYALGVGAGMDPLDQRQLAFLADDHPEVLPSMAVVLAWQGFWVDQAPTGINIDHVLHGEQRLTIEAPLPPVGAVRRKMQVTRIVDRGEGRGAFVCTEDRLFDAQDGRLLARLEATILCRDEGGRGGSHTDMPAPQPIPERAPDGSIAIPASPQQALIYRLSGDTNPLHSDPIHAANAGFPRPILHGLASYGTACLALLCELADGDPARLRGLDLRFTSPVFPGEALRLDYWRMQDGAVAFRLSAVERDVVVASNGRLELVHTS